MILDCKRGDIASSMKAYGQMAFDTFHADALTVSPYLGVDVLAPLVPWLKKGCGVYSLCVTSNPAGFSLQMATNGRSPSVAEVFLRPLVDFIKQKQLTGSLGLVIGATVLGDLPTELLEKCQQFPLLLPGLGA